MTDGCARTVASKLGQFSMLWNCDHIAIYDRKKKRELLKKELTSTVQIISPSFRRFYRGKNATYDRLEVTSSWTSAEVLHTLFRAVKSSISRTALVCSSALHCSLICERPGPWYRRAVFIGDDLAVQSSPRPCAPHGQGALVALVGHRRQPHTLGSIDQHEYCGYACRSEHFLFQPCLSA
jgi:hypothetical protein